MMHFWASKVSQSCFEFDILYSLIKISHGIITYFMYKDWNCRKSGHAWIWKVFMLINPLDIILSSNLKRPNIPLILDHLSIKMHDNLFDASVKAKLSSRLVFHAWTNFVFYPHSCKLCDKYILKNVASIILIPSIFLVDKT